MGAEIDDGNVRVGGDVVEVGSFVLRPHVVAGHSVVGPGREKHIRHGRQRREQRGEHEEARSGMAMNQEDFMYELFDFGSFLIRCAE